METRVPGGVDCSSPPDGRPLRGSSRGPGATHGRRSVQPEGVTVTAPDWQQLARTRLVDWQPRPRLVSATTRVTRSAVPCIDVHNHLGRWLTDGWAAPDVGELLELMDAHGVATVVNLDGMWGDELEANLDRYDRAHPGRFLTFGQLDWTVLCEPD